MDGRRTVNPNNKSSSSTAQDKSRITVSAEQSSGFREVCVKCPIEYRTTKSTTQKLWQIIKFLSGRDNNSWPDEDGNHSNEQKNLDNRT